MIVDCDRCDVRGDACKDCVITVLLGAPPEGIELDGADRRALHALAEVGMVPRLQLVDRDETRTGSSVGPVKHSSGERSSGVGERLRWQVS